MSTKMNYEEEYYPARHEDGLQALIQAQVNRAPWWLMSVAAHMLLGLGMWLTIASTYEPERTVRIISGVSEKEEEEIKEELERDVFSRDCEIPAETESLEDPMISDAPVDDINRTDDNEETDGCKGEDLASDKPFHGKFWSSTVGVGGGAGGPFGGRFGSNRRTRAAGGKRTEAVVQKALLWLQRHQNPDGMWSTDKFMSNCRGPVLCTGKGETPDYDMGNTGLATLAFLGCGNTHNHGFYKNTVLKALQAIKERQLPNGCFGAQTGDGHWIYNHLITTMAVAEAYGLSRGAPLLKPIAQKAVDYIVECQNPGLGWRYGSKPGDNDTSCTGWAVLALKSAKLSKLSVPREAFEGAANWIDKVTEEQYYKTGYSTRGDGGARLSTAKSWKPLEAMTAAALTARIFMGESARSPKVIGAATLLKNSPPKWNVSDGTIDMYYWYYGALGMYQMGGPYWTTWNAALKDALIPTQHTKGCLDGSWDPVCAWGSAGGRVYSTAINALTLEIYYRYSKVLNRK